MHCGYFDTTRKSNHCSFLALTVVGGRRPFRLKFALKVTHPFEKRRLRQIFAYNVSTVRVSEKVQLWRIGSRPRASQRAIDGVRTLPLSPPRGGSKSDFLKIKFNFNRLRSATKFLCVKLPAAKLYYSHSPHLVVHRYFCET